MNFTIRLAEPLAKGWSQPRDVSLDGWRIDHMITGALVAITVLFVVMVVWMLYACIHHGRKHAAEYTAGDSRNWRFAKLGIAGAIFCGVDGVLFFHSARDLEGAIWNFAEPERNPAAVRVEINARQWSWEARYAGLDGKFNTADDVVTLNDVRAPVDTPVLFQLVAVDVIHCLYIPNLRVKQDVVPGMITRAWVQANEAGAFEIGCAQHCGVNHYKMRGTFTVMPRDEFQRWLEQASEDGGRSYNPSDQEAHWGWSWRREI
jgi:cytochrome c oxidase subunit II